MFKRKDYSIDNEYYNWIIKKNKNHLTTEAYYDWIAQTMSGTEILASQLQKIITLRKEKKWDVDNFYPPKKIKQFTKFYFVDSLNQYCERLFAFFKKEKENLALDRIKNHEELVELKKHIKLLASTWGIIKWVNRDLIDKEIKNKLIAETVGFASYSFGWDSSAAFSDYSIQNMSIDPKKDKETKLNASDFTSDAILQAYEKEKPFWDEYLQPIERFDNLIQVRNKSKETDQSFSHIEVDRYYRTLRLAFLMSPLEKSLASQLQKIANLRSKYKRDIAILYPPKKMKSFIKKDFICSLTNFCMDLIEHIKSESKKQQKDFSLQEEFNKDIKSLNAIRHLTFLIDQDFSQETIALDSTYFIKEAVLEAYQIEEGYWETFIKDDVELNFEGEIQNKKENRIKIQKNILPASSVISKKNASFTSSNLYFAPTSTRKVIPANNNNYISHNSNALISVSEHDSKPVTSAPHSSYFKSRSISERIQQLQLSSRDPLFRLDT